MRDVHEDVGTVYRWIHQTERALLGLAAPSEPTLCPGSGVGEAEMLDALRSVLAHHERLIQAAALSGDADAFESACQTSSIYTKDLARPLR